MKDNLFIQEYKKANILEVKNNLDINDEIYFDYLDILKDSEVEVLANTYVPCKCIQSVNLNTYYEVCNKCHGSGYLLLNGNKVICNDCKGNKVTIKEVCPLCNGKTRIIKKDKIKVKLNRSLKENDLITILNKGKEEFGESGNLYIKVKIRNKERYLIKNNDVYDRKVINYSKEEINKNITKVVDTIKGKVSLKPTFNQEYETIKLEGKGIENGDFYVCVKSELTPLKGEDVYKNVILEKDKLSFYVDISEFDKSNKNLTVYYYKKLNDYKEYEYIELEESNNFKVVKCKQKGKRGINGGVNGDLYLRIYYSDEFKCLNDEAYHYPLRVNRNEIIDGKKVIEYGKDKIVLNGFKNINEETIIEVKDYGFMIDKNNFSSCKFIINPNDYENYKVSITVNKKVKIIYLNDYKYYFYEEVKANDNNGLRIDLNKKKELSVIDENNNRVNIKVNYK